jgi:hypothetical protein
MKMDAEHEQDAVDGVGGADIAMPNRTRRPSVSASVSTASTLDLTAGWSAFMTRLCEKTVFSNIIDYIDGAHRGEVDIGCRSSHM